MTRQTVWPCPEGNRDEKRRETHTTGPDVSSCSCQTEEDNPPLEDLLFDWSHNPNSHSTTRIQAKFIDKSMGGLTANGDAAELANHESQKQRNEWTHSPLRDFSKRPVRSGLISQWAQELYAVLQLECLCLMVEINVVSRWSAVIIDPLVSILLSIYAISLRFCLFT